MKENIVFSLILTAILLSSFSANSQSDGYSIKNRWTLKASATTYKMTSDPLGMFPLPLITNHTRKIDFRLETNYGINKFVEVGIYAGTQLYEYKEWHKPEDPADSTSGFGWSGSLAFAPLFGVNANIHFLPFIIKSEKCPWDLYLTAKYGGCYIIHQENEEWVTSDDNKYRQEYGLGIGAGYHFKNKVGIFAEYYVGQYTWQHALRTFTDNNFRFRIGITSKFGK